MASLGRWLIVVLVAAAGCVSPAPPRPLRIGLVVWPPYEMPVLARSLGRLDPDQVELVDFGSAAAALRAYRNQVVDGVALPTTYVVELAALSNADRVVLVIDVSDGGDAIVAAPPIDSVRALAGRRIGVERSSLGRFIVARALREAGLGLEDVELVSMDVNGHESAFADGRLDAMVTYEPHRSRLLSAGARDIFNSSQMPGEIVDVLVVTETTARERSDALAHLSAAWFEGVAYLREHPADAARRVAPREGLTPEDYLRALGGSRLLDRRDNQEWLTGPAPRLDPHLQSLTGAMQDAGLVEGTVDTQNVRSGEFVQ